RLFFNRALPVDLKVEPSQAPIPGDEFDFATTAAGFGDVRLGALHGAILAAVAGNEGVLAPVHIIASVEGETAPLLPEPERALDIAKLSLSRYYDLHPENVEVSEPLAARP